MRTIAGYFCLWGSADLQKMEDGLITYLYINLRRSRNFFLLCLAVRVDGCLCVSDPRFIQFALGSCYLVHMNALSIIIKVYI